MSDEYKVSLVTVVFNRFQHLNMLLRNVFEYQDMDNFEFEVVVVDDGSTEDLLPKLLDDYGKYNIKYLRTNRKERAGLGGIKAGRSIPTNLGVSVASGRVIVVCDAEGFMLEPNHLTTFHELVKDGQIMAALPTYTGNQEQFGAVKKMSKHPNLVKDYVLKRDTELQNALKNAPEVESLLPAGKGDRQIVYYHGEPYFTYRCSGYWAQTRKSYIDMGGFDERAWGMSGDDYEFSYRLDNLGFKYIPSKLHILHNFHGIGDAKHYTEGKIPETPYNYITQSEAVRQTIFEEIDNRTMRLNIPWKQEIYDDDLYCEWKIITVKGD